MTLARMQRMNWRPQLQQRVRNVRTGKVAIVAAVDWGAQRLAICHDDSQMPPGNNVLAACTEPWIDWEPET